MCVRKITIGLLHFLSAFLYAQGASVWSIKDLNGTNIILSLWGAEEKCTAKNGCENNPKCQVFRVGLEKFCFRLCAVDGDCEKHMECNKFWGKHFCFWKPCTEDADCEYSSICMNESSNQKDGACLRPCDCGNHGTCRFEKGQKICDCDRGFLDMDGICTECDCGTQGICRFEKGIKECDCDPGFVENNGKCTDCICRGGACVMEGGRKVCKCPPGFGNFTTFSCKACDCGTDANCIWEGRFGGNKICLCKPGYSTKKGKCVACECGPDSSCEWISEEWLKPDKKVCHCKPGYHEKDRKCVDKQNRRK